MNRIILSIFAILAIAISATARSSARSSLSAPDLEAIKAASTDETSPYYYPTLLKEFMANDTTMTDEAFQYFYYGTFFQEDYDPYREQVDPDQAAVLAPLFNKKQWSRAERKQVLDFALNALADNPVNLRQLNNRIFVYEQNGKYDLAKIWQYKLNHLLLVIASSGTGLDAENAWIVVYPQDEYDFLNISGITAREQQYQPPYYDYIIVNQKSESSPKGYYFNINELLHQYYLKHPSELDD
jgi:hypothetical protein